MRSRASLTRLVHLAHTSRRLVVHNARLTPEGRARKTDALTHVLGCANEIRRQLQKFFFFLRFYIDICLCDVYNIDMNKCEELYGYGKMR